MGTPFAEIALVLLAAALGGAIGTWLRDAAGGRLREHSTHNPVFP